MKDFNGVEIEVGDVVAYITNGYRRFSQGTVTKINPVKISIGSAPRDPHDVIVIKKVEKPLENNCK